MFATRLVEPVATSNEWSHCETLTINRWPGLLPCADARAGFGPLYAAFALVLVLWFVCVCGCSRPFPSLCSASTLCIRWQTVGMPYCVTVHCTVSTVSTSACVCSALPQRVCNHACSLYCAALCSCQVLEKARVEGGIDESGEPCRAAN